MVLLDSETRSEDEPLLSLRELMIMYPFVFGFLDWEVTAKNYEVFEEIV